MVIFRAKEIGGVFKGVLFFGGIYIMIRAKERTKRKGSTERNERNERNIYKGIKRGV